MNRKWVKGLLLVLGLAGLAGAGDVSLINPDSYRGLTSDRHAYHVGDILTVLVVESTSAESAAGTGANSNTSFSAFSGGGQTGTDTVSAGVRGDTAGNGQTSRRGLVRANVSVRITEMLPDGVFRVAGQQALTVNDERQVIRIAGLVRSDDISYENAVFSYRLADAVIDIKGDGVVADAQKQNVFYRFFKWLRIL